MVIDVPKHEFNSFTINPDEGNINSITTKLWGTPIGVAIDTASKNIYEVLEIQKKYEVRHIDEIVDPETLFYEEGN